MIKIDEEENTIYLTRGNEPTADFNKIAVGATYFNEDGEEITYKFKPSDKIKFAVFDKKGYKKEEIICKEFKLRDIGYYDETESFEIPLTSEDTYEFPISNKAKTYWYDILLNDSITILGFDEDGAKKLILYPEGDE